MACSCRNFTIAFKKEVVAYMADGRTAYQALYMFRKRIKRTTTHQTFTAGTKTTKINVEVSSRIRFLRAGRKPLLGDLEEVLYDEILELRISNIKVTHKFIRDRATQLAIGINLDFVSSARWVTNFVDRNKLALRRTTNLTLLSETELVQRAVNFYEPFAQNEINM